jgi:hypothetical protein
MKTFIDQLRRFQKIMTDAAVSSYYIMKSEVAPEDIRAQAETCLTEIEKLKKAVFDDAIKNDYIRIASEADKEDDRRDDKINWNFFHKKE